MDLRGRKKEEDRKETKEKRDFNIVTGETQG